MAELPRPSCNSQRDMPYHGMSSLIFQLVRHLATALDRRLAPYNVTAQQSWLLVRSCVALDVSPARLASALGTDAAGVTRLLDRLEAKGLVVRRPNPADRRAIVIEPTDAGRALVPQLIPAFREVTNLLLANVSTEEVEVLERLLRRMLENLAPPEEREGHEGTPAAGERGASDGPSSSSRFDSLAGAGEKGTSG